MTKLSPDNFDTIITPKQDRIIWTADAIGHRIGTSADFVRDTLALAQGTPVHKVGGRYCASETELMAFFKAHPTQTY